MLHTIKIELIKKYSYLLKAASEGKDTFGNEICNFLVNEFNFSATVLFKVEENNKLTVIGRSNETQNKFLINSRFSCSLCPNLKNNTPLSIHSDSNCEVTISDFVAYESCIALRTSSSESFLFKLAKKNSFSPKDAEPLKDIFDFIQNLLSIWLKSRKGNLSLSENSFSFLVDFTLKSLRNSTNSILGITSILAEQNLSSAQLNYINTIKRSSQALIAAINDLKALTLIEKGDVKIERKPIEIKNLLGEVIEIFNARRGASAPPIAFHIDENVEKIINTDQAKFKYIINSLLRIIAFISGGEQVELKVTSGASGIVEFTFVATNKSLPQSSVSNFFDPLHINSDPILKSCFISGIETNLIGKYVNLLNGDISIKSNGNTEIKVRFRASGKASESSASLKEAFSNLPKPGKRNKVLIIEDDYATSRLMSNYLKKWGYQPVVVNTEEQAMAYVDKESFLAIILDIELPQTNGLELLKKLNHHPNNKNTPVIACSVEAEEQKAFLMGAVEYFVKPINYNFLLEVLTSYKLRSDSKILCVDDDLPTLNLIKQAIETAGYQPIAEHISANVMDKIKDENIDLAIIDLDMPHPNGIELIKQIKSLDKFKYLPIIIYTGKENYQDDINKIQGLFTDLLNKKSSNIEDLAETINRMIKSYEEAPPVDEVMQKKNEPKILLAEDYKHSQIIVTRLLKKHNFNNIVIVENGEEALEMVKKEKFDLILMDMQMPIMNGFEAIEKIRELPDYKNVPIISLTAFAMRGDREKCLAVGATDYIPKPIDSQEFIEKVKYYINQQ